MINKINNIKSKIFKINNYREDKFILTYPSRMTYTKGEGLIIYAALGLKNKSKIGYIRKLLIFSIRDNSLKKEFKLITKIFKCKKFNHSEYKPITKCETGSLESGMYYYQIVDEFDNVSEKTYFLIYDPIKKSEILLLHPNYTYHAYNKEGGDSFYWGEQYNNSKKITLSLLRPLIKQSSFHMPASLESWENFLYTENYSYQGISMEYFNQNLSLIKKYKIVIIAGHNEYMTHSQYECLENFLAKKGNIFSIGGNQIWWAIEQKKDDIYIDKNCKFIKGESNEKSTGKFNLHWINKKNQNILGLSYLYGGYPVKRMKKERALKLINEKTYENSDNIEIINPEHKLFENLKIDSNTFFNKGLIDIELDGIFIKNNKVNWARVVDTPKDIKILAKSLCWVTNGRVSEDGRFTTSDLIEKVGIIAETKPKDKGGIVITIGSIGWLKSIAEKNSQEYKINLNALNYLLEKN